MTQTQNLEILVESTIHLWTSRTFCQHENSSGLCGLTGDVAVVVGAVVVLQEGNQSVKEVMWTQHNQFLQHICKINNSVYSLMVHGHHWHR